MPTILLVEDDILLRKNIYDILDAEGYSVETAVNGKEGLQKSKDNTPDLIISDVMMPEMDGYEFIGELQKDKTMANIPFIFLTAKIEIENLRKGMNLGADDYLTKPFSIDDLLNAVNARLRKKQNYTKELEDLKESFIRKVPHELRTPLVGIMGFSELIEEDILNMSKEEIKELVGKIRKSSNRLYRRIEKFLAYSNLLNGEMNKLKDLEKDYLSSDIDENTISYIIQPLLNDFDRKEDVLITATSSNLLIYDKFLFIIIKELVENALKFSPSKTKIIINGFEENINYCFKILNKVNRNDDPLKQIKPINAFKQFSDEDYQYEGMGVGIAMVEKILTLSNSQLKIKHDEQDSIIIEVRIPIRKEN